MFSNLKKNNKNFNLGKTLNELQSCVEWMVPFAIAIKNVGLSFLKDLNNEKSMIQTHTISLELLVSDHVFSLDFHLVIFQNFLFLKK